MENKTTKFATRQDQIDFLTKIKREASEKIPDGDPDKVRILQGIDRMLEFYDEHPNFMAKEEQ